MENNNTGIENSINTTPKETKMILVVDDILYILKSISSILKDAGYIVINAMTGMETLDMLKKYTPDLITIDQKLPDTTGVKLVDKIMGLPLDKKPKIIFISAVYDKDEIHNILKNNVISNYIMKPFKKSKLLEVIKELIGEP